MGGRSCAPPAPSPHDYNPRHQHSQKQGYTTGYLYMLECNLSESIIVKRWYICMRIVCIQCWHGNLATTSYIKGAPHPHSWLLPSLANHCVILVKWLMNCGVALYSQTKEWSASLCSVCRTPQSLQYLGIFSETGPRDDSFGVSYCNDDLTVCLAGNGSLTITH